MSALEKKRTAPTLSRQRCLDTLEGFQFTIISASFSPQTCISLKKGLKQTGAAGCEQQGQRNCVDPAAATPSPGCQSGWQPRLEEEELKRLLSSKADWQGSDRKVSGGAGILLAVPTLTLVRGHCLTLSRCLSYSSLPSLTPVLIIGMPRPLGTALSSPQTSALDKRKLKSNLNLKQGPQQKHCPQMGELQDTRSQLLRSSGPCTKAKMWFWYYPAN